MIIYRVKYRLTSGKEYEELIESDCCYNEFIQLIKNDLHDHDWLELPGQEGCLDNFIRTANVDSFEVIEVLEGLEDDEYIDNI